MKQKEDNGLGTVRRNELSGSVERQASFSAEKVESSRRTDQKSIEKKVKRIDNSEKLRISSLLPINKSFRIQNFDSSSMTELPTYQFKLNNKISTKGLPKMILEKYSLPSKIDMAYNKKLHEFAKRENSETPFAKPKGQILGIEDRSQLRHSLEPRKKEKEIRKRILFQPTVITVIDQAKTEISGIKCQKNDQDSNKLVDALDKFMNSKLNEEEKVTNSLPIPSADFITASHKDYYGMEVRSLVPAKSHIRHSSSFIEQSCNAYQMPPLRPSFPNLKASNEGKSLHSLLLKKALEQDRDPLVAKKVSQYIISDKSFRADSDLNNSLTKQLNFPISQSARKYP